MRLGGPVPSVGPPPIIDAIIRRDEANFVTKTLSFIVVHTVYSKLRPIQSSGKRTSEGLMVNWLNG